LESAACKEWNTERGWEIIDDTVQIRGGRGYETEQSLARRGEEPIGVERMLRDFRINRIFEGSTEIMHLIIAREAVDKHLEVAGKLIDRRASTVAKLLALPKIAVFYAWWYPTRWLGWGRWPRYAGHGALARHLRFVDRAARKLARESFHGMLVHRDKMERRQLFLFRLVDVVNELFAMSAAISRATTAVASKEPAAKREVELADTFCRGARRRIAGHFRGLWRNDDARKYALAQSVLAGEQVWMEELLAGLGGARPPLRHAPEHEPTVVATR
jgi:alkylation response protein AidB-like acyl-CoA dehydrogenase